MTELHIFKKSTKTQTGTNGTMTKSLANQLVGTRFPSLYWLQLRIGF